MFFLKSWIFRTVLDSASRLPIYLKIGIINRMIFSFYIFHSIKDFYSYEKNLFKDFMKFSKNYLRKKCLFMLQVSAPTRTFFWEFFLNFQSFLPVEQLWTTNSNFLNIFSWNCPIIHLSCLKPIHLSFDKNKYLKTSLKNNQFTRF